MTILEESQIIFNLVMSIAAIIAAVTMGIATYKIIKCANAIKKFFNNVGKESSELYEKIEKFLEKIFRLSFLAKFFKKNKKAK